MNEHSHPGAVRVDGMKEVAGSIGGLGIQDALTELIRRGAVDLLASAVRGEVAEWIDAHAHVVDGHGRRQIVRLTG